MAENRARIVDVNFLLNSPLKPYPSQAVPKYRKHKASGQAIVTLTGVDHYQRKSCLTRMLGFLPTAGGYLEAQCV